MDLNDYIKRIKSIMGIKIDEGIDFVFQTTPELIEIGTKEQYEKYVKNIFPSSKYKGIVYHGSSTKKLTRIDKRFYITWWSTSLDYVRSRRLWRDNISAAVINIKNPLYTNKPLASMPPEVGEYLSPAYTPDKYDSVIGVDAGQENWGGKTIAVKNNKVETHILGTKEDIVNFKKYMRL